MAFFENVSVSTKKTVLFIVVGTVCALAIIGAFIPDARNYVVAVTGTFMTSTAGMFK